MNLSLQVFVFFRIFESAQSSPHSIAVFHPFPDENVLSSKTICFPCFQIVRQRSSVVHSGLGVNILHPAKLAVLFRKQGLSPEGGKISDEAFGAFRVFIVVDPTDVWRDESGQCQGGTKMLS
jgi:hypothetical protein